MARIPHLRVIIETQPNSGAWNMAVDEVLLLSAISDNVATLRFYRWSQPTISLGYFQRSNELSVDAVLSRLPTVRRLSGGGAILHDNELTHSIALPSSQTLFERPHELYGILNQGLTRTLRDLGFPVVCRGETTKQHDEPLLCFQRQDANDVTLLGQKVIGSAQRRRRGAILQHGSIIYRASPLALHLPGLLDLCDAELPENLAEIMANSIAKLIAESWTLQSLTTSEIELIQQLYERIRAEFGNH